MFNLLDVDTGDKVDFWMLTDSEWDQERFRRRQQAELFGMSVQIATAEDTILAKLRWSQLSGGSEKQRKDAVGVWEVQEAVLDKDYISRWVHRLGLVDEWNIMQASLM